MLNQKKIKEDIKNTNILFFALIHPLALIISNSIAAIIIGVNSDKELWTAISIGTAVAIPIIYFLDMLRKRRINQIRDVYNSSDRKAIYAYEKKRNIIVGLISIAFIIGLISNAIQKLSVGNDGVKSTNASKESPVSAPNNTSESSSSGSSSSGSYSSGSSSRSSYSSGKSCSWCGNSFSGNGYNYIMGECISGSDDYYSKCSRKCCNESRRSDPNLSDKWKR